MGSPRRRKPKSKSPSVATPDGLTLPKLPTTLEEAILGGRCILFVGSGLSRESEAPAWRRLLEDIAHRFSPSQVPRVERYFSRNEPWGAADLVCGSAPRPELNTFVRDRLDYLQPAVSHRVIARTNWAASFTTNYDRLIEDAYHTETLRAQALVPVYQFSKDYNIHESSKVHLFKLHGSIDQIHVPANVLVLTTKDLTDTLRQRSAMLSQIPRLLLDYYWLFIGYGFTDGILRQLLNEIKKNNRDTMPRESFAVLPSPTEEGIRPTNPDQARAAFHRAGVSGATWDNFL